MDLLKPPENFINFDTPNRENNIQGLYGENNVILGRGSYGIVLRARYKKRNVAVKVLEKSNDIKYDSLKQEANILNLSHANIVRILKVVDCETYGAIIMERFDGKCLQEFLDYQSIDLIHRLNILSDITKALVFCHENGIVHSDVKPQNVLVAVNSKSLDDRAYVCKLFDFGCSIKIEDVLKDDSYVGGTVRYCAPEVLQNHVPDCSADIFSLAVIMWQMKENKIPYASIHANETIIWNVVKKDMRPDSLKAKVINDESLNLKKSRRAIETSQCKSDSLCHYVKISTNQSVTPKLSNRKIPEILIDKPFRTPEIYVNKPMKAFEKSSFGLHQKHQRLPRNLFIRKKLFDSCLSPNRDCDENESPVDRSMRGLFIDHQLCLRSPEKVLLVEKEYVKMYSDCWHTDKVQRYSAVKVLQTLQTFINSL